MSLLPVGIMQTWARIFGDAVFVSGAFSLVWFALGLRTGHSFRSDYDEQQSSSAGDSIAPVA